MLNILNTITAGNALFLAFLILTVQRDANRTANRWLALFFGLFGFFCSTTLWFATAFTTDTHAC